jgi:hypothetical protein
VAERRAATVRWAAFFLACALESGQSGLASPAHRDPYPLPADTLQIHMREVGEHGPGGIALGVSATFHSESRTWTVCGWDVP